MPVSVKNISFRYDDDEVLTNLSVDVSDGQTWLVSGGNGSGKTTLGRLICGLAAPDRGSVTIDGQNTRDLPASERIKAAILVPQIPTTFFLFSTVLDELVFCLKTTQKRGSLTTENYDEILELYGLGGRLHCHPDDLSISESWRLCLAICHVAWPKVLYVDEVLSTQSSLVQFMLKEIVYSRNKNGLITFIATHRYLDIEGIHGIIEL